MEDHHQWHDPLLLTDAISSQQQPCPYNSSSSLPSSSKLEMANLDSPCNPDSDIAWRNQSLEADEMESPGDPLAKNAIH
ncbi:hypothetical protein CRG98_031950, partial [Punica granatum]